MAKKQEIPKGLMMTGSFRRAGMTFYMRNGQMIARVARSMEKRSCTRGQFVQRMRMRHTIALWHQLQPCQPMFTERKNPYLGFASLANRMPAVYITKEMDDASLLMPGIPVSEGTLPTVKQHLGELDGSPALLTNLKASSLHRGEKLMLYTAVQRIEGRKPRVLFEVREVKTRDMVEADRCLAMTSTEFADEQKGWALVRVDEERCSPPGHRHTKHLLSAVYHRPSLHPSRRKLRRADGN